jgi:uncharacterized protein
MIVVSDTSPITNLAAIRQLELLQQLYVSIVIPTAVFNEMAGVDKIVPGAIEVQTLPWIQKISVVDFQQVRELQTIQDNIDLGEAEAIVLALELKADLLLMDERRGRALATSCGINVIGLLGILLQAKHKGLVTAVKPLIDQLRAEVDFGVSEKLYIAILESAGE